MNCFGFSSKLCAGILFATATPLVAGSADNALISAEGATLGGVQQRPVTVGDSSALLITTDLIERWIELHRALLEVPESVRAKVPRRIVRFRDVAPELDDDSATFKNWGSIAGTDPEVAAAFKDAKIAPAAYAATASRIVVARALIKSRAAAQQQGYARAPKDTTTVIERAVAVIAPMLESAAAPAMADKDYIKESKDVGGLAPSLKIDEWLNPNSVFSHGPGEFSFNDGNIYLIGFTATWCGACPYMYPAYESLVKDFAGEKNVRILFVSPMFPSREAVVAYFQKHHVTLPVIVQGNSQMGDNSELFKVQGWPESILIDQSGVVRSRWVGGATDTAMYRRVLNRAIHRLLAKPTATAVNTQSGEGVADLMVDRKSLPLAAKIR